MWVTIRKVVAEKAIEVLREKLYLVEHGSEEHQEIAAAILELSEALETKQGD